MSPLIVKLSVEPTTGEFVARIRRPPCPWWSPLPSGWMPSRPRRAG